MATKLKSYEFGRASRVRYPWGKWEDGSIWKCTKGRDFQISPVSFRMLVYHRAMKSELKARTRIDGEAVIFQFYKNRATGA